MFEPEEEAAEWSDGEAALSNVCRGRGSGGSETLPSTGILMTIMVVKCYDDERRGGMWKQEPS